MSTNDDSGTKQAEDTRQGKLPSGGGEWIDGVFSSSSLPFKLAAIGRRECPVCEDDLKPAGESSLVCLGCGKSYPYGRVP